MKTLQDHNLPSVSLCEEDSGIFLGHWEELNPRIPVIVAEHPLRKSLCFLKSRVKNIKVMVKFQVCRTCCV